MKKIGLLTVLLIVAFMANAQKGQKQFNAGLGFANNVIPVYVGFDYWVHDDISIGTTVLILFLSKLSIQISPNK